MRRFAMIVLSTGLLVALTATTPMFAQDEKKDTPKPEAKKDEAAKTDAKKEDTKKEDTKKQESTKEKEKESAPLPIPQEVEAKLEAARRAVAEAIVAAQDAGLVQTSIDPPPILDILITGRANDEQAVKAKTGVSPEVFGAWYTGYGKTQGVVTENVRIINPSAGLRSWYNERANMLSRHIKAVRDAKAKTEPAKKAEEKKDETKK